MKALAGIFNSVSLAFINLAIIVLAELVGGGTYFHDSGLIHGLGIFFLVLAFLRAFSRYKLTDPVLKRLLDLSMAALFLFAAAHTIEFFTERLVGEMGDMAMANTVNLYLAGLLLILGGTEHVLRSAQKRSVALYGAAITVSAVLVCVVAASIAMRNPYLVSLEAGNLLSYAYAAVIAMTALVTIIDLRSIRKCLPLLERFSRYVRWAIGCLAIAAIVTALHTSISSFGGAPDLQIDYVIHFLFYAGISVMFIAFGKVPLGGVYRAAAMPGESGNAPKA